MAKKEIVKNPGADLVADVPLPDEQLAKLSLFAQLKRTVSLEKFPNFVVVRRFRKRDLISRQGEPGWTAFYILTPDDSIAILEYQLAHTTDRQEQVRLQAELLAFRQRAEKRKANPDDNEAKHMATVHLAVRKAKGKKSGVQLLENNRGRPVKGTVEDSVNKQPIFIPVDATITASFESLRAPLMEGEIFGEISCLYRTPRTATIVANRDCYMLEMLRNILEAVQRDPGAKGRSEEMFRKRFLEIGMRKLSLFGDLNDEQFEEVKKVVELVDFKPGQLICDEYDRADGVYVIRSGLVKAMRNTSVLVTGEDIKDWGALLKSLQVGVAAPMTPLGKLWAALPESSRAAVSRIADPLRSAGVDRSEVLFGINEFLKNPAHIGAKDFEALRNASPLRERARELLATREALKKEKGKDSELPDPELRRFNRLLLETLMPQALRPARSPGAECILNYYAAGEYIGETGVLNNAPQNVSCLAYGQPNDEGEVLAVKIPAADFRSLCDRLPPLREKVKRISADRRRHAMERLLTPVWDDSSQVQLTERFEELGLIQGQKLMLIDLEKCTRCDECVQACVETHDDGRTRLFLDGPRFGKYLVPVSCRACLDPVCMIPCPVSSIHRGANREMVIEDWCIGCGLCAEKCPYGSIQMHDLGIVPERARGWQYTTAVTEKSDRWRTRPEGGKWLVGTAPLFHDRDMREQLKTLGRDDDEEPIFFRLPFTITAKDLVDEGRKPGERRPIEHLKLIVTSFGAAVKVWMNGTELPDCRPKQGRREYAFGVKGVVRPHSEEGEAPPAVELGAGRHVLAVAVTLAKSEKGKPQIPAKRDGSPGELLMAGLYAERRPDLPEGVAAEEVVEEVTEKLVSQRAVVCDLCSELPGRSPACVRACPHDAAFRIDARKDFPQN